MRIRFFILSIVFFFPFLIFSQNVQWKINLNYFFDNAEFAKSTLTKDQTMTGVHFSPQIGLKWDNSHTVFAGTDLLKISGSQHTIDSVNLIAYYRFQSKKNCTNGWSFSSTRCTF